MLIRAWLCQLDCWHAGLVAKKWRVRIPLAAQYCVLNKDQGTKIFQYCTCPAGRVTYNFHLSCKHMHLSFKSVCNKNTRELYVIWLPRVILPKALVLQVECFWKNYSSFVDFTRNYERTSGIFVPWRQYISSLLCTGSTKHVWKLLT